MSEVHPHENHPVIHPDTSAAHDHPGRDVAQTVHCRFRLDEETRIKCHQAVGSTWKLADGIRVKLYPVQGEPFGSATPSGQLEMVIVNPEAIAMFKRAELHQEFNVVISAVPHAEEAHKA